MVQLILKQANVKKKVYSISQFFCLYFNLLTSTNKLLIAIKQQKRQPENFGPGDVSHKTYRQNLKEKSIERQRNRRTQRQKMRRQKDSEQKDNEREEQRYIKTERWKDKKREKRKEIKTKKET